MPESSRRRVDELHLGDIGKLPFICIREPDEQGQALLFVEGIGMTGAWSTVKSAVVEVQEYDPTVAALAKKYMEACQELQKMKESKTQLRAVGE